MTCRFLENLSLASLVAPLPEAEFRSRYWEREPVVVHRGDPGHYDGLFSLEDFDDAITRSPEYVKMANAETKKNVSYKPIVAQGLEAVLADMRAGGTLVLDQVHRTNPNLGKLCSYLVPEFGHRFQTNLYLTPPRGKGFSPHWDNHDVFILQVLGTKHWRIEKTRRILPMLGEKMGDEDRELRGDLLAFTLKQGDLIYIPRGFVHAAECGDEPSLHVTLGVTAVFLEELLRAVVKAALQRDESLRTVLPLGFMQGAGQSIVNRVVTALRKASDEGFIAGVVDQYRDELVRMSQLDASGQIVDFFRPKPLTLEQAVGPRRGIVFRMHDEADSVRLLYGARQIVFPGFFRESLRFALQTPSYPIRAIPGDIADEERLVFIERLVEEGLLVRM